MNLERHTYIPFGETASPSIDYLLGILKDARITTIRRVYNLNNDELHWQYAEGWNTIGCLLSHIIAIEHAFRISFIELRELTAEEEEKYMPGLTMGKYIPELITNDPISTYLAAMEESRASLREKLIAVDFDSFQLKREGYNPNTGYNMAWALYHLAEDEVHHRGQISIIRKLYRAHHQNS